MFEYKTEGTGIDCNGRGTACADQLAQAIHAAIKK
jgi:hypothetical protein